MHNISSKNAIITYIFNSAEILRTPLYITPGTQYICVTDNKALRDNVWNCIYDKDLECVRNPRDKMALVKYNPFKYVDKTIEKIIVLDGTYQITNSLDPLLNTLNQHYLALKTHPVRISLYDEIHEWQTRGLSKAALYKFLTLLQCASYPVDFYGLYETCVIGYKNNKYVKTLCNQVIKMLNMLGDHESMFMTNQCPLTFLINKYFGFMPIYFFNSVSWATRYIHNSWTKNPIIPRQLSFALNKQVNFVTAL